MAFVDPVVVWAMAAAILLCGAIWCLMFVVVWILDRVSAWIHRRFERGRRLR